MNFTAGLQKLHVIPRSQFHTPACQGQLLNDPFARRIAESRVPAREIPQPGPAAERALSWLQETPPQSRGPSLRCPLRRHTTAWVFTATVHWAQLKRGASSCTPTRKNNKQTWVLTTATEWVTSALQLRSSLVVPHELHQTSSRAGRRKLMGSSNIPQILVIVTRRAELCQNRSNLCLLARVRAGSQVTESLKTIKSPLLQYQHFTAPLGSLWLKMLPQVLFYDWTKLQFSRKQGQTCTSTSRFSTSDQVRHQILKNVSCTDWNFFFFFKCELYCIISF